MELQAPSPLFSTLTPLFRNEGVVPDVQVQIEMKEPAFLQGIFNYCELCVSSEHSERAVKPL
jgi:hypothetical protein